MHHPHPGSIDQSIFRKERQIRADDAIHALQIEFEFTRFGHGQQTGDAMALERLTPRFVIAEDEYVSRKQNVPASKQIALSAHCLFVLRKKVTDLIRAEVPGQRFFLSGFGVGDPPPGRIVAVHRLVRPRLDKQIVGIDHRFGG